jgi:hypothetical protein
MNFLNFLETLKKRKPEPLDNEAPEPPKRLEPLKKGEQMSPQVWFGKPGAVTFIAYQDKKTGEIGSMYYGPPGTRHDTVERPDGSGKTGYELYESAGRVAPGGRAVAFYIKTKWLAKALQRLVADGKLAADGTVYFWPSQKGEPVSNYVSGGSSDMQAFRPLYRPLEKDDNGEEVGFDAYSKADPELVKIAATPEQVASQMMREFPALAAAIPEVSRQTTNVHVARWLMRNVVPQAGVQAVPEALGLLGEFDKNKQRIKANGKDADFSKYDLKGLQVLVESLVAMNKSKTQKKQYMPQELINMITAVTSKALKYVPRTKEHFEGDRQAFEKAAIFDWFNRLFIDQCGRYFDTQELNDPALVQGYTPWFEEIKNRIVEDKVNYAALIPEFYSWKYSEPVTDYKVQAELSTFKDKAALNRFNDQQLTQEQRDSRYDIEDSATEGFDVIEEGGFRAIKVVEWNDHFADELCKVANWCVRDKRAFEDYNIGPNNPIYLISKGRRQMALVGFESGQMKDVNDSPADSKLAMDLLPIVKRIGEETGNGIPFRDDFDVYAKPENIGAVVSSGVDLKTVENISDFDSRFKASLPADVKKGLADAVIKDTEGAMGKFHSITTPSMADLFGEAERSQIYFSLLEKDIAGCRDVSHWIGMQGIFGGYSFGLAGTYLKGAEMLFEPDGVAKATKRVAAAATEILARQPITNEKEAYSFRNSVQELAATNVGAQARAVYERRKGNWTGSPRRLSQLG